MPCVPEPLMLEYVDGRLRSEVKLALSEHVTGCETCRQLFREMSRSVAGLQVALRDEAAEEAEGEHPPAESVRAMLAGTAPDDDAAARHAARCAQCIEGVFLTWGPRPGESR